MILPTRSRLTIIRCFVSLVPSQEHHRPRIQYVYPPSPTSDTSPPSTPSVTPALPLSHRLRLLQAELATLETELADPSNPLLQKERDGGHDPGELIRGMVDVKNRLDKISKVKEGKGKLVSVVLGEDSADEQDGTRGTLREGKHTSKHAVSGQVVPPSTGTGVLDVKDIVEMDRRVGELEKIVGSSGTALDEVSGRCCIRPALINCNFPLHSSPHCHHHSSRC